MWSPDGHCPHMARGTHGVEEEMGRVPGGPGGHHGAIAVTQGEMFI
jgi:hypothetical protein